MLSCSSVLPVQVSIYWGEMGGGGGWVPVRYSLNAVSSGLSLKLVTTHMHNDVMAGCL